MKISRLLFYIFLSFLSFYSFGQSNHDLFALSDNQSPYYTTTQVEFDTNLLNSVNIRLDKASNSIVFGTQHTIKSVNVTVKQRGEKVIVQQKNITINNKFSIVFPPQAARNQYTVILQKDNHILVKRLEKDW